MLDRLRGLLRFGELGAPWPYRLFRTNTGVGTSSKSGDIECLGRMSFPPRVAEARTPKDAMENRCVQSMRAS